MNAKFHFQTDVNHLIETRQQSLYPNVERARLPRCESREVS